LSQILPIAPSIDTSRVVYINLLLFVRGSVAVTAV
jgi:hypothetical protein